MYQTEVNGQHHELGTSGFLYRSNKLMYDAETKSLWSTLAGEPVVGRLVGQGIKLKRGSVVTTTWNQWKRRHPSTSVLSLDTGHRRNYGEGVAYQKYFATDSLMFTVPKIDTRLKNKDEVVALRSGKDVLAIASSYLKTKPLFTEQLNGQPIVVLTDSAGSHRIYETGGRTFSDWNGENTISDSDGTLWTATEDGLATNDGQTLPRVPSHRAFWFGWQSQYPNTRLIKSESTP